MASLNDIDRMLLESVDRVLPRPIAERVGKITGCDWPCWCAGSRRLGIRPRVPDGIRQQAPVSASVLIPCWFRSWRRNAAA
jgi:hypothetical protein